MFYLYIKYDKIKIYSIGVAFMYNISKNTTSNSVRNLSSGFTTIELITTFGLTLVIVVLLLQVIVVLKDVYINKVVVNSLRVKQAVMVEKIMDDFDNKNLEGTAGCVGVSNCISFIWEDGTVTELKIDKTKNTFSYADYVTELTGGSSFGNLSVVNSAISEDKQRKFISFNFPIYSTFVKGDYGIHVIYQYNPTKTGINASSFGNTTDGPSLFVLTRDNPVKLGTNQTYNESTMGGYKAFYNNAWNTNPTVKIQYYGINGTNSTEYTTFPAQSTTPLVIIKYTYTAPDGKVYTQTRNVIYTDYAYDYTGSVQTFVAPASGYYKFQAWGAQGGSYTTVGGKGAYTSGVIYLAAKENIYVYVGQSVNQASTSYNGGGAPGGSYNSMAGGGATDFRLTSGNWNDSKSLASRIMVAGGGAGSDLYISGSNGGFGGSLIGGSGGIYRSNTTYAYTVAQGGTQIAGGNPGIGVASTGNGSFGIGGSSNNSHGSGGGIVGSTTTKNFPNSGVANNNPSGGSQTAGGGGGGNLDGRSAISWLNGKYGIGGGYLITQSNVSSGGGGGLYGGGASWGGSGAGGSGYIGNSSLLSGSTLTKHMTCYNCTTSTDASTKTNTTTNVSATPIADYAKIGNGYAKITYIGVTN